MDFDKEFTHLTERLKDLDDPDKEQLSLAHLSDFADTLSNVASHLNRYITMSLSPELPDPKLFEPDFVVTLTQQYEANVLLADLLCDMTCGIEEEEEEDDDGSNN